MMAFSEHIERIRAFADMGLTERTYRTKDTYFTRNTAKLTFKRLAAFILGNNRNSAQIALNDFFEELEETPVAKQTLFEAREKISYEAFSALNDLIVDNYYSDGDAATYKAYTLLGVDGSLFQAPQGALREFGGQKSARCETVSSQARAVVVSDVLNRVIVNAKLKPVSDGEIKISLEMLEGMRLSDRCLLIFDRGFYTKELASAINEKCASFLFRIKNRCQKDIDAANEPDQIIAVGDGLRLRIINFALPTGEVEKLATNIFDDSFTISDFAEIYRHRWGVETSCLMVKERLCIENFTSAKKNLMLQDFYAAVATYNLMEIACLEQETARKDNNADAGRKHKRMANRNIAAHEVRKCLLSVIIESDPGMVDAGLERLSRIIYNSFIDLRPNRHYPRKTKFPSKKYPMNKKLNL
jgi:hypothetical protein